MREPRVIRARAKMERVSEKELKRERDGEGRTRNRRDSQCQTAVARPITRKQDTRSRSLARSRTRTLFSLSSRRSLVHVRALVSPTVCLRSSSCGSFARARERERERAQLVEPFPVRGPQTTAFRPIFSPWPKRGERPR